MSQPSSKSGSRPGDPVAAPRRDRLGDARRYLAGNRRSTGILLGLILVGFVVAGGVGLRQWRQAEEREAAERVPEQAEAAALRAGGFLTSSSPALAAGVHEAIADGDRDLSAALGVRGEAWALDRRGEVVASTGAGSLGAPPEAELARDERIGVSGLLRGLGGRVIRVGLPISRGGPVVAVVAILPPSLLAGLLAPAIEGGPGAAEAAVLGTDGRALLSGGLAQPLRESLTSLGPGSGTIDVAGERRLYSVAPIGDLPWNVVLSAPESVVLATADGPAGWLEWAIPVELGLVGLLGILLLMRLLREADQVDLANVELSERSSDAEQATEAKSGFISTLAHEMRTPLAAISMFADLMRTDEREPLAPGQRRRATDIAAASRHLLGILGETVDLSRVEAGRLELRPEPASIAAIAIEVSDGLHPLALERGIDLSIEADGRLGEVFTDPGRLRQVMTNFLSNALKFTPRGGRVRMRVERSGDDAFEIAVDDTGVGIEPEDLDALFTPGHSPVEPQHPGDEASGLGLALSKRLVEAMGGTVAVRSRPGRGSTFSATLPRARADFRLPPDAP